MNSVWLGEQMKFLLIPFLLPPQSTCFLEELIQMGALAAIEKRKAGW